MQRRTILLSIGAAAASVAAAATAPMWLDGDDQHPAPARSGSSGPDVGTLNSRFTFHPIGQPARTVVRDRAGTRVAELTHGSRTVLVTGPERTFTEPRATRAVVKSTTWVRIAERPFDPVQLADEAFATWLLGQIGGGPGDDVLAAACQYVTGSAERVDRAGVRYAGDASFGYINEESTRDGADFYDYLGIPWTWPTGEVTRPAVKWAGALDCSGYIRLIFGYRMGMLLHRTNRRVDDGLPRTAYAIATRAPSTLICEADEPDQAPRDLSRVAPGDVAFFALHDETPATMTHCGIVLGPDTDGGMRFVSSRESINGPTFGDVAGAGVIDSQFFGDRLRRVIRL
jgi:cell wall-associated NlpC family hydrolase